MSKAKEKRPFEQDFQMDPKGEFCQENAIRGHPKIAWETISMWKRHLGHIGELTIFHKKRFSIVGIMFVHNTKAKFLPFEGQSIFHRDFHQLSPKVIERKDDQFFHQ